LLGVFREELPFHEVPIKVYFRTRQHEEQTAHESQDDG
jgi:hypothetical protein